MSSGHGGGLTTSPPTPAKDARLRLVHQWLEKVMPMGHNNIAPASADASFRRYFRVEPALPESTHVDEPALIVMDAPPDKEDIRPWLDIAHRLRAAGLHAPAVIASDADLGLVLMEDLGGRTLLAELNPENVDAYYSSCMDALFAMQTQASSEGLPIYNENRLLTELELFPRWFLHRHLGYQPDCEAWSGLEDVFRLLINQALAQPKVFVHRDYHSRNLMLNEKDDLAIIDFQDAVKGPLTYDLVSLLKDCYIQWSPRQVQQWMAAYHQRCFDAGLISCDRHTFRRWFDLMGLQRHLKVLGIFCRLWYRDGKTAYLNDLPLVLDYVLEVCGRYGATQALGRQLEQLTVDIDITKARS